MSFSGIAGINIGNTVCDPAAVEAALAEKENVRWFNKGTFGSRELAQALADHMDHVFPFIAVLCPHPHPDVIGS